MDDKELNRITLIVEGLESDQGHVRLDRFLAYLKRLYGSLSKLDSREAGGQRASQFVVVGLSHNSPATVEIEARAMNNRPDVRPALLSRFCSTMESVQRGVIPDDIDYRILEDLRELAAPVGRDVASARLSISGNYVELTEVFAKRIDAALAEVEYCQGAVEGMLEQINFHDGANVFTIYPEFGRDSVACHFPKHLEEMALAAVKRRVSVGGRLKYRKNADYPHHVYVEHIEIYQDVEQLPSFDDLFGIAPNICGDIPSEDFVSELRHGWQ